MKSWLLLLLLPALLLTLACSKEKSVSNPQNNPPVREPTSILLQASYPQILPGGNATIITATLFDQVGDPVNGGYSIMLTITDAPSMEGEAAPSFSFIANPDSALFELKLEINSQGQANAVLYSGTAAGPVTIKAALVEDTSIFVEEDLVLITVSDLASVLLSAEPPEISVGYNSTMVYASVFDTYGNRLGAGFAIRFEIVGGPLWRASFLYPPSDDSVLTIYEDVTDNDGRAEVEMFSGIRSGQVQIRATALLDTTIYTEEPLVRILAGPIAWIDMNPSDQGIYSDGDSIFMHLYGACWDQYTNPANDTTAIIELEVEPDTSARVVSPVSPDSIGLFHSVLSYTSAHLGDNMVIIARVGDVAIHVPFVPALYSPELSIVAVPDVLHVSSDNPIGTSDITAELRDGFGFLVEGFLVDFLCQNCGILLAPYSDTTDINGLAHTRFYIDYAWLPDNPRMCQAKVIARLLGYPDCEADVDITCYGPMR